MPITDLEETRAPPSIYETIPVRSCKMNVGIIRSTKCAVKLITDTA